MQVDRETAIYVLERLLREDKIDHQNRKYVVRIVNLHEDDPHRVFALAQKRVDELFQEAIEEIEFFFKNGGINPSNCDHVEMIVKLYGVNSHQAFQEAWEQCEVLRREGVICS